MEATFNGWANWDTWNTWLLLTNTEALNNRVSAWGRNFYRKHSKGRFDLEQAAKAVRLYLVPVAIKQDKNDGGGHSEISRKAVNCQEIAQNILDDAIEDAEYAFKWAV